MKHTSYLSLTALFAALVCLTTAYIFHIPIGVSGGYIHFGDALIYLAASLLPIPYALASAAIGGVLADLFTAPAWAPATLIIKMLIVLPVTSKKGRILVSQNIAALLIGTCVTVGGYFVAEGLLFGSWAAAVPSMVGNLLQGAGSAVIFLLLGNALDKMKFKQKFL